MQFIFAVMPLQVTPDQEVTQNKSYTQHKSLLTIVGPKHSLSFHFQNHHTVSELPHDFLQQTL